MPIRVNTGKEILSFPDDATDAEINEVLASLGGDAADDAATETRGEPNWLARMLGMGRIAEDAKQPSPFSLKDELTNAGGLLGAAPAGVGALVGALADGERVSDAATSGATAFAVPKALEWTVGKLRPVASSVMRRGAVRAMKGALKPDRGYLEKMAGAKRGGIAKMETEIVETALDNDVNVTKARGLAKLQEILEQTAAERTAKIDAAPNVPVKRIGIKAEAAARRAKRVLSRGDASQDDIAVAEKFLNDLKSSPRTTEPFVPKVTYAPVRPGRVGHGQASFTSFTAPPVSPQSQMLWAGRPSVTAQVGGASTRASTPLVAAGEVKRRMKDLTPRQLSETIEAGNDRLRGLFNGQSNNAEIQARLRVQRARTRSLDDAAGTRDLSTRMRRLIDLQKVGNIATRRAEANNPVSLTDIISLSAGRPGVFLGSVAMKPSKLAGIALAMNRTGKSLATPSARAEALRRLLIAYGANDGAGEGADK
jgi:hypothetical protein